jgi:D-alanine-D-alanine ligase
MAEDYVDGRELYVGVLGNQRLRTLPTWELFLHRLRDEAPRIATARLKFDIKYQERVGADSFGQFVSSQLRLDCSRA